MVSLSAFTSVPDRVTITCHEQYVSRLSSGFRGDISALQAEADAEYPDDEIHRLCSHMLDDTGDFFVEVSWYQCGPDHNTWFKISGKDSPLFEDAPELVLAYLARLLTPNRKPAS